MIRITPFQGLLDLELLPTSSTVAQGKRVMASSASLQRHCWMRRTVLLSMATTITWTLPHSCCGFWASPPLINTSRRRLLSMVIIPRAAVSVVVRSLEDNNKNTSSPPKYVLVQRGKEPNKGMWSLPGGKIQAGESTLAAAQRELREETQLSPQYWHNQPFCVVDSIHRKDDTTGEVLYHYVIAQCFCCVPSQHPLMPSDDASDARWFHLEEMHLLQHKLTPGVIQVIETCENMYEKGLLSSPTAN